MLAVPALSDVPEPAGKNMDTMIAPEPEDLPSAEPDWGEQLFESAGDLMDNPEPRCPGVLLLDTSSSMAGQPLAALDRGLATFRAELLQDPLARQRVEVALVTFGSPVEVVRDFVPLDQFLPPPLQPRGLTPLGTGLLKALDLLEVRQAEYRKHGLPCSRPWIFLVTDGMPQGERWEVIREALQRVKAAEAARKVVLFAVGVEGANMKFLARLSERPPLLLTGLRFVELFTWLSASAARLASPAAGAVELPALDESLPGVVSPV
jgi:uncharacterized protein YegL